VTAETPLMIMGRLNQVYMTLSGARAQLDSMDEHIAFEWQLHGPALEAVSDGHRAVANTYETWLQLGDQVTLLMAQVHLQRVNLALHCDLPNPHELQPVRSRTPARIVPKRSTK